jgi:site-specific DNA recombinase
MTASTSNRPKRRSAKIVAMKRPALISLASRGSYVPLQGVRHGLSWILLRSVLLVAPAHARVAAAMLVLTLLMPLLQAAVGMPAPGGSKSIPKFVKFRDEWPQPVLLPRRTSRRACRMRRKDDRIVPRNRHTLVVGIGARISGCEDQKEASLDDQMDNARQFIAEIYDGPVEFELIAATKAKGEWLDRPELKLFEHAFSSGRFDFIVFDDLSRLIRGGDAVRLLGIGIRNGTRTISVADEIDTLDTTWEEAALTACSEAVAHVQRTSNRIKQKCMNRFRKRGKVSRRPIAGYTVPPDAETYDEWSKDDAWTETIREGVRIALRTHNCEDVAGYFREKGFPRGPYAKKPWDGTSVRAFFRNEILKGQPYRGKMHSVKDHTTGHRNSVKNPKGPEFYDAPHLAHLSSEVFDELNATLDAH